MNKVTVSALLVAAFAVGCAAATVAAPLVIPPVRADSPPTRWEYACFSHSAGADAKDAKAVTDIFNRYGAQGWELAAGAGGAAGNSAMTVPVMMWCFKHPVVQ